MIDSSTINMVLGKAIESSRKNESTLNKILGGLIVLASMQACALAIGSWLLMTTITNSQDILVIKETLKIHQKEIDAFRDTMR